MKEDEIETEKFLTANTQELGKEKWLCPLSGKKFKGPEFVRKHILNKHGDKLDEVKKEVRVKNSLHIFRNQVCKALIFFTLFAGYIL
jgi:hypothetical protein